MSLDIAKYPLRGEITPAENNCIMPGPFGWPLRKPDPRPCCRSQVLFHSSPEMMGEPKILGMRPVGLRWNLVGLRSVSCCGVPEEEQVVKGSGDRGSQENLRFIRCNWHDSFTEKVTFPLSFRPSHSFPPFQGRPLSCMWYVPFRLFFSLLHL